MLRLACTAAFAPSEELLLSLPRLLLLLLLLPLLSSASLLLLLLLHALPDLPLLLLQRLSDVLRTPFCFWMADCLATAEAAAAAAAAAAVAAAVALE
jgi:hypothetical protein